MKKLCLIILSIFFFACQNTSKQNAPIRVLIIDGFSNHDWEATTRHLLEILSRDPQIICEVSTIPDEKSETWASWQAKFSNYDVVIQNTNDIGRRGSWPESAKSLFDSYIKNGGGMLAFHSANNAFPDWPAYNEMIGLGWRKKDFGDAIVIENEKVLRIAKGKGENTGHGKRFDALITRLGNHPIHMNLPKQWRAADLEVYRYARGPAKNLTVLSFAKDAKTQLNFPVEWIVNYGEGRIYTSTYGHHWHNQTESPAGMRCAAFQTLLLRSIYWLAKREVPNTIPDNFPRNV